MNVFLKVLLKASNSDFLTCISWYLVVNRVRLSKGHMPLDFVVGPQISLIRGPK